MEGIRDLLFLLRKHYVILFNEKCVWKRSHNYQGILDGSDWCEGKRSCQTCQYYWILQCTAIIYWYSNLLLFTLKTFKHELWFISFHHLFSKLGLQRTYNGRPSIYEPVRTLSHLRSMFQRKSASSRRPRKSRNIGSLKTSEMLKFSNYLISKLMSKEGTSKILEGNSERPHYSSGRTKSFHMSWIFQINVVDCNDMQYNIKIKRMLFITVFTKVNFKF